jgi:hypothetical protein
VAFNMHKLKICAPCTSLDQRLDFALLIKFSILLCIRLHVLFIKYKKNTKKVAYPSLFLFPTSGALETLKFKATVTWSSGMKLWSNRTKATITLTQNPCIEQSNKTERTKATKH